jgi:hypothetical protein
LSKSIQFGCLKLPIIKIRLGAHQTNGVCLPHNSLIALSCARSRSHPHFGLPVVPALGPTFPSLLMMI